MRANKYHLRHCLKLQTRLRYPKKIKKFKRSKWFWIKRKLARNFGLRGGAVRRWTRRRIRRVRFIRRWRKLFVPLHYIKEK